MAAQPSPQQDASALIQPIDALRESVGELAKAQLGPAGESYLTIPIQGAQPQPPDVTVAEQAPGGVLVSLTPPATATTVNRTDFLLQFPFTQAYQLTLTRIHLNLPVSLVEVELTSQIVTNTTTTVFKTEAEATEAFEAKGGHPTSEVHTTTISYPASFEERKATITYERAGTTLTTKTEETVKRSVLPVTLTLVARIKGPDGELWSGRFEVPLHYVSGTVGTALGTGLVDEYADLQNPVRLNNQRVYGLELLVLVPTTVKTKPFLVEEVPVAKLKLSTSAVTLFYDVNPATVGK